MAETIDANERPATTEAAPHVGRRQRRPTGAPPPLPRKLGTSGWIWLGLIALVFGLTALFLNFQPTLRLTDQVDTWILQQIARVRATWLTHLARGIKSATSAWALTTLALATVVVVMFFRRWRHLLVFFASMFLLWVLGSYLYTLVNRPRPYGVRIIGAWSGFSMPSPAIGLLSVILACMVYCLTPAGRPRNIAKWVVWGVIGVVCVARLYLAVDHPSDVAF